MAMRCPRCEAEILPSGTCAYCADVDDALLASVRTRAAERIRKQQVSALGQLAGAVVVIAVGAVCFLLSSWIMGLMIAAGGCGLLASAAHAREESRLYRQIRALGPVHPAAR